ncbi:MAG: adenine deaminase [Salinarimonadaceae bacterium]|nr:MAG: adenine deaminase [Salinarimonadaceae bacterium]
MTGERGERIARLARRIAQGRGEEPADCVIADVRLYDLVSGKLIPTDIAICGDTIVATYGPFEGRRRIEGRGRIAVPGFIDTHLHVESSLVTPLEFDRCVLPHGVTTAICDPHEMANVLGVDAFDYFLACARHTIMDLRVQLSSCVPATDLETSGAEIDAEALARYRDDPQVIGLAEFMNFPGLINGDPGCLAKLAAFEGRHIDGHAPLLRGADLDGYIAAGVRTEHEATTAEEALEKMRKGMTILIREGSVSKDLHALAPLLDLTTSAFMAFCTDDRNPLDIAEEGHLDYLIRTAIAMGRPPLAVYRAASLTAAAAFGLNDRGLIAPGRRADIVLLDDLAECRVSDVISAGRLVDEALFAARGSVEAIGRDSMKAPRVSAADFRIPAVEGAFPVIGVIPGKIITEHLRLNLPVLDGAHVVDPAQDVAKVAVVERHGRNGNIGRGFVKGFGMKRGAIASSVGHDSHNVTIVGADDSDMALAANRLGEIGGGFVVASGGKVLTELPLPIAGLMSEEPFEHVRDALGPLRDAARSLGVTLAEPFLQVAFLPLPVIPHLKISDRGLVDVDRFALIDP